jgi:hypothetical protein
MARGTGRSAGATVKAHARATGVAAHALPSIRTILTGLQSELEVSLVSLPADRRRELIAASGLLERPGIPALIGEALIEGIIPEHLYRRGDFHPEQLVERLLPFSPAMRVPITSALRAAVIARDGLRGGLEHLPGGYGELVVDHFVPVCLGGPTTLDNLWLISQGHNAAKLGSWPSEETAQAFVAQVGALPSVYFELLALRPWRQAHDLDQSWVDEVDSHRRRTRRQQSQLRREALRTAAL